MHEQCRLAEEIPYRLVGNQCATRLFAKYLAQQEVAIAMLQVDSRA
jgi:hypothetical protein